MNIGLIIILVGSLLVLIIGYNIMLQYKTKVESSKKHEASRYLAVVDATEDLIGNAHHMPYSHELLVCLNQRILDALENMYELTPKNKQLAQRIVNMKNQIEQLKTNPTAESTSFKVPNSDKQAIVMLKLVKRLRDTIRSEHNKGRFNTQAYVTENARLEMIQIRINIENVIKRANESVTRGQVGTARQLLKKGLDVLAAKNDAYSHQAREKLQSMLDNIDQNKKDQNSEMMNAQEDKERNSDMEALFGEKKKW